MYRRRRPPPATIAFSFDSFLDVVANVIGIIVRLILVAWVGARSYTAAMQWVEPGAAGQVLAAPKASDDPLHAAHALGMDRLEADRRQLRRIF